MWGTFLSEPLLIVGLVGRCPANCLIRRIPIHFRLIFRPHLMPSEDTWGISLTFARLFPGRGQVGYVLLTRAPVDAWEGKPSHRFPSTCMC